jgi:NADH-quinone oxidoreductase subunit J
VLFLFVVMMLDVDFSELRQGFLQYLPVGVLVGVVFLAELLLLVGAWTIGANTPKAISSPIPPLEKISNTEAIGLVLYTKYVYFFELAGMLLLVSMIGAIVLTLHHRVRVHRQNISVQNARTAKAAVELRKVRPGQGVDA